MMTNNRTRRKWWQRSALCKYYARIAAATMIFLGLASSDHTLGWSWLPTAFPFIVGGFLAYAGFLVSDEKTVQDIIEGIGWLLVVVKGGTALVLLLVGEPIHWNSLEFFCLVGGFGSILAGRYLKDPLPTREHEEATTP